MNAKKSSQLKQFYRKSSEERLAIIRAWLSLPDDAELPLDGGLTQPQADHMIENVIGRYALPLAVATNFLVNKQDYLVPMVVEEPSVVAAVSFAAKLFRQGGGFHTSSDDPVMIGQIQVLDVPDIPTAIKAIDSHKDELLHAVDLIGGSIIKRGGGARDLQARVFEQTPVGPMLILHLHYDTRDAMGANAVNTAVEHIAPRIEEITGGRVNLRILSNLTDQRKARAKGMIPVGALARENYTGPEVVAAVLEAAAFAEVDPYRATTHNKGVMNGIDAVILATGNDWRAVEAGAHAYAARDGRYTSLTRWWQDEAGNLHGEIELPLAVGVVGGATRAHPTAQLALQLLGVENAGTLAEIIAAVGLAQNFAAMRALATDGIQKGHMRMHVRQLAISAGTPVEHVEEVAGQMIREENIRLERAKTLARQIQQGSERQ